MPTCLEAVQTFFANIRANNPDMLARWTPDMETQINVSGDGGERHPDKKGVWTDGVYEWFPIRIPKGANADPYFRDFDMPFSLAERAESIGCTGWDWVNRRSRWVGFDFDAIVGHAAGVGVSDAELARIRDAVQDVPWVEVRRSTGGNGLHLYVYLDRETANHNEHAALAQGVLRKLADETGIDLSAGVDVCGGNMWIWSRRATAENGGLSLIKPATGPLTDIPDVPTLPSKAAAPASEDVFDQLAQPFLKVPLDDTHRALIDWLSASEWGNATVWDSERHLLRTHSCGLAAAHQELAYLGLFRTVSAGKNPDKWNCYAYPRSGGEWEVRSYRGNEAETWNTDGGTPVCEFNRLDLDAVVLATGGNKRAGGGYDYLAVRDGLDCLRALGIADEFPEWILDRELIVRDGEVWIGYEKSDDSPSPRYGEMRALGWSVENHRKNYWTKLVETESVESVELAELDPVARFVMDKERGEVGWFHFVNGGWGARAKSDIGTILGKNKEVGLALLLNNPWTQDGVPFGDEYPGERIWNRVGAQLAYPRERGEHPTFDEIFRHNGRGLDEAVQRDSWCQTHGVRTGADYLRLWAAIMFQHPASRLPYLLFSGSQNVGKSTFGKTLRLTLKSGFASGKTALTTQSDFNGELEGAVLVVVEETDVSSGRAQRRMKDWVASDVLSIRPMYGQVRDCPNYTHWIQTANDVSEGPISGGDTRVVVIEQRPLERRLDWDTGLKPSLVAEAPAFLWTMFNMELPPPVDRFWLPTLDTNEKQDAIREHEGFDPEALKNSLYALVGMRAVLGESVWQGQPKELHEWLVDKPETVAKLRAALRQIESSLADMGVAFGEKTVRGKRLRIIFPTEKYWEHWTDGERQAELLLPDTPGWTRLELLTILQAL